MPRFGYVVTRLGLVALPLAACSETVAPPDGILLSFRAVPATVRTGDSFRAILAIANTRPDSLVLSSGDSCVATLTVVHRMDQVSMTGSGFACLTVPTSFRIPPGDSLVRPFRLKALVGEDKPPFRTFLAPGGPYAIHARMHVELPDVAAIVVVKD